MSQSQFSPLRDSPQRYFEARDAGIVGIAVPAPTHNYTIWWIDYQILAAALVLGVIAHAKPYSKAAADSRVALGQDHWSVVRPPPLPDAVRRDERLKNHGRPRCDASN